MRHVELSGAIKNDEWIEKNAYCAVFACIVGHNKDLWARTDDF